MSIDGFGAMDGLIDSAWRRVDAWYPRHVRGFGELIRRQHWRQVWFNLGVGIANLAQTSSPGLMLLVPCKAALSLITLRTDERVLRARAT